MDFSDVKNYQFNENCICNNLLQKLIVYGKNASGKSNLGLALFDIVSHDYKQCHTQVIQLLSQFRIKTRILLNSDMFLFSLLIKSIIYTVKMAIKIWYERVILNDDLLFEYNYAEKQGNLSGLEKLIPTLNLNFRGNDSLLKYAITNSALPDNHPLYQMMSFYFSTCSGFVLSTKIATLAINQEVLIIMTLFLKETVLRNLKIFYTLPV